MMDILVRYLTTPGADYLRDTSSGRALLPAPPAPRPTKAHKDAASKAVSVAAPAGAAVPGARGGCVGPSLGGVAPALHTCCLCLYLLDSVAVAGQRLQQCPCCRNKHLLGQVGARAAGGRVGGW